MEAEARRAAVLDGHLHKTNSLMKSQQAQLRAHEASQQKLEAKLAAEAAAREAQSDELSATLERLETLKAQVGQRTNDSTHSNFPFAACASVRMTAMPGFAFDTRGVKVSCAVYWLLCA